MAKSLATNIKALETQIPELAHTLLGPLPEGHVNIVKIISENQVENSRENYKEVKETSGEKNVEIEKTSPTPPKKEVVDEVEKKTPYIDHLPRKPPIPFSQRFMEAKVGAQFKSYAKILENINTNVPLSEVLSKKRKLEGY